MFSWGLRGCAYMELPDYHSGSIVNLMASLQSGLGGRESAYAPLELLPSERVSGHRQVLLWVVDGLGLRHLRAHPQAACLNSHLAGGVTSVFPPTTAAAITSFLTGDAPQQHGLTGWHMYFRELGSVLAVLPGRPRYGGTGLGAAGIDVRRLLDTEPFSERIERPAYTVSPAYLADSDFSLAHLGTAQMVPYQDLDDLVRRCSALLCQPGAKYLYTYWPELDSLGHRYGIWSEPVREHLLELDRAFAALLDAIQGTDTLVVVCADHGQIDVPAGQRIDLNDHPVLGECLALPLCGELRAAYCYLRPGRERTFDDYIRETFAGIAETRPSAELIESGWFGVGTPHPRLIERIGDRVLLLNEGYLLKDRLPQERCFEVIGVHGGISEDELWVPLVLAEC